MLSEADALLQRVPRKKRMGSASPLESVSIHGNVFACRLTEVGVILKQQQCHVGLWKENFKFFLVKSSSCLPKNCLIFM